MKPEKKKVRREMLRGLGRKKGSFISDKTTRLPQLGRVVKKATKKTHGKEGIALFRGNRNSLLIHNGKSNMDNGERKWRNTKEASPKDLVPRFEALKRLRLLKGKDAIKSRAGFDTSHNAASGKLEMDKLRILLDERTSEDKKIAARKKKGFE